MILAIYKEGQRGIIGRFYIEVVATTYKRLFLNRKLYTSSEVSGEYSIYFKF